MSRFLQNHEKYYECFLLAKAEFRGTSLVIYNKKVRDFFLIRIKKNKESLTGKLWKTGKNSELCQTRRTTTA